MNSTLQRKFLLCTLLLLAMLGYSSTWAFSASSSASRQRTTLRYGKSSTVEAPTREDTDRVTDRRSNDEKRGGAIGDDTESWDYHDMEYLLDPSASRENDDPFHILLLGSTFEKPKVTVPYVAGSLEYVLGMPSVEAKELSKFAKNEGMSCLGTWPRDECLSLGKQLQVRDIVCRVVPFAEGGHRGWQAKDVSSSKSNSATNWS